jgi:hypothetical protein
LPTSGKRNDRISLKEYQREKKKRIKKTLKAKKKKNDFVENNSYIYCGTLFSKCVVRYL